MRVSRFIAWTVCILIAMPASALAQSVPYQLGPQDRLRIHVHEWPALTGEFSVGAAGAIVLPLIGEVKAAGLVASELASSIGERLRARAKMTAPPETVVDVVQYRPFYIVGGVDRPGEYSYRPDMIVLNAVSIAGGYYRQERSSEWGLERDVITSLGEMRTLSVRKLELQAREMRSRAEASDAPDIPVAADTATQQQNAYVEQERAVFNARRETYLNQVKSLEASMALAEREIQSLSSQIETVQSQHDSAKRELADTRQHVSRGISQATRLLPLERAVAQIEREKKELEAAILRTRQQINQSAREIRELIDERKSTAAADLQTVQVQLQEVKERERTANRMIGSARSEPTVSQDVLENPDAQQVRYFLVREVNGLAQEIEATETTRVLPGDIIKVFRSNPTRNQTQSLSGSTTTGSVDGVARN